MKWTIESVGDVLIVRMNSNSVNKQNPDFFSDLQTCFDELDEKYPLCPVILTGNELLFSAGIDFEYSFNLFKTKDLDRIARWFTSFSEAILRVFESNRLTVAAVNGHCFAGGLILALCCDFRYAVGGKSKFSLNEVPIGIPMPATYTEIIRHRVGETNASDSILTGEIYDALEAKERRFFHDIVSSETLIETAIKKANCISKDAWEAYALSKEIIRKPIIERIRGEALAFDKSETVKVISSDASIAAQSKALSMLKG